MKLGHYATSALTGILITATAYAADVMTIAANTEAQLGKATYCGFETDEFAKRAGRAIDNYAGDNEEKSRAIKQFMVAATMAAQAGPIGESCNQFRKGFEASLRILKEAGF